MSSISLNDQHTMKPQQMMNDVTTALRPAAFKLELAVVLT